MVRSIRNKYKVSFYPDASWLIRACFSNKRTARLQLTDELISNLNVSSQVEETNKDMQRIQELLSLPQNEDVVKDSSGRWAWLPSLSAICWNLEIQTFSYWMETDSDEFMMLLYKKSRSNEELT